LNESNEVRETQNGRETEILTVEYHIPGGLRFYWENETGKYSFSETTVKQARNWAHDTAKRIGTSDSFTNLATAIDEIPTSDAIEKVKLLKELRQGVRIWLGQYHPTERQWRIMLMAFGELADRFIWLLAKYFEGKVTGKLTVHWEVEPLPGDGGIYRILLERGHDGEDVYRN
jgi:hypothetical protein